jgi:DNA-directed RNA polymerase I and III subunit RPAC2
VAGAAEAPGRRADRRPSFLPSSPDVAFCGYSIPHPSEKVVNLRIQTTGATSAAAALRQAAVDLKAAATTLRDVFAAACEAGEAGAAIDGAPPAVVPPK